MGRLVRVSDILYYVDVTPRELGVPFICSYVVVSGDEAAIIETGPTSSSRILYEALEDGGIADKVKAVIPTHIHLDHGGGTGSLLGMLEGAVAYLHPRAVKHIASPSKLWESAHAALGWLAEVYGEPEPGPEERLVSTSDGMVLRVGNVRLRVVHTPGHASHHQSVYLEGEGVLFVGDSAGIYVAEEGYVVPTTMPVTFLDMYLKSLDKQLDLGPSSIAYTHFGIVRDGVELLKRHKEQVRGWFRGVKEALSSGVAEYEEMLEYISRYDPEAERLRGVMRRSRAHDTLIRLAIEGFKLEVERLGSL